MDRSLRLCGLLAVAVCALLVGCNQTLDLDEREFYCDEQSDCAVEEGFVCDMSTNRCVQEGEQSEDTGIDSTPSDTEDAPGDGDDTDEQDTQQDADTSDGCGADSECAGALVCVDGSCESCSYEPARRGECSQSEICTLDNQCASSDCQVREDCPDGYACDVVGGTCLKTEDWCRSNADCDQDGGEVCNVKGRCTAWNGDCNSTTDCYEGSTCQRGTCRPSCADSGDCTALCGDSPCFCNVAEGLCAGPQTGACSPNSCFPTELICLEPAELCGRCDSLTDCASGEFCNAMGECDDLEDDNCRDQSDCEKNEICLENGACEILRCDYTEIRGDCPDFAYCAKTEHENIRLSLCQATTCDPTDSQACSPEVGSNNPPYTHCIGTTDAHGVCQASGILGRGTECSSATSNPDTSCKSGHACLPVPGTGGTERCEELCNPWDTWGATENNCSSPSDVCVPFPGVLGICKSPADLPDCTTVSRAGVPCDDRSLCVPDSTGQGTCVEVCRVDEPTDCNDNQVCNPALVPGDVGMGSCAEPCNSNSDCPGGNRRCRELLDTGRKYCAKRCGSDADCGRPDAICKDGFCD